MVIRSYIFKLTNATHERVEDLKQILRTQKLDSRIYDLRTKVNEKILLLSESKNGKPAPGLYYSNLLAATRVLNQVGTSYDHFQNLDYAVEIAKAGLVDDPKEIKDLYLKEEEANIHYAAAFGDNPKKNCYGYIQEKDKSGNIEASHFTALRMSAKAKLQALINSAPSIDLKSENLEQQLLLNEAETRERVLNYIEQLIQKGFPKEELAKIPHELLASIPPHLINSVTLNDSNYFELSIDDGHPPSPKEQSYFHQDGLISRSQLLFENNLKRSFEKLIKDKVIGIVKISPDLNKQAIEIEVDRSIEDENSVLVKLKELGLISDDGYFEGYRVVLKLKPKPRLATHIGARREIYIRPNDYKELD